jgi:hypothetical protein
MLLLTSALTLLVARVDTDDAHDTVALDHLALVTNLLDAGTHLHGLGLFLMMWPREGSWLLSRTTT